MNYKKESGKRVRGCREDLNLTLREVSAKLSGLLSPSRISNYEQGIRQLGPREALALSKVLGVNPAYLMCLDEGEGNMTKEEIDLLRDFRALPENHRREYSRRIGALALAYRDPVADEKVSIYANPLLHQRRTKAKRTS